MKDRDQRCLITSRLKKYCHAAHVFPYSLGKSQNHSALDIWKVLEMFWGLERKTRLQEFIFGDPNHVATDPRKKTRINSLYNMLTLCPDAHALWAAGQFILEPIHDDSSNLQSRATSRQMPDFEGLKELLIDAALTSFEIINPTRALFFDHVTETPIRDGHIITFSTSDPISKPLPSKDLLELQASSSVSCV